MATPRSTASVNGSTTDVTVFELEAQPLAPRRDALPTTASLSVCEISTTRACSCRSDMSSSCGMTVEAEALPQQRVEVLGQEVGQEERAELFFVHRRELLGSR